jgi:hypothetical protein
MSAFNDTRGKAIDKYNAGVDFWTSTGYAEFAGIATITPITPASGTYNADASADVLKDDDVSKLKTYTPAKFVASSVGITVSSLSTTQYISYAFRVNGTLNGTDVISLTSAVRAFYVDQQTTTQISCNESVTNDCLTKCNAKSGYWSGTYCMIQKKAEKLCVRINKNALGVFFANNTVYNTASLGYGCEPGPKSDWNIAYSYVTDATTSTSWNVMAYIRSSYDPYIYAAFLTNGTYDFGMSTAEKIVMGLVLMIIGGLMLCCLIYPIVLVCKHMNKH